MSQATMDALATLTVDDYTVTVTQDSEGLSLQSDTTDLSLRFDGSEEEGLWPSVYINAPCLDEEHTLIWWLVGRGGQDGVFVKHFEVPRQLRGEGLGKLGLALFYTIATHNNRDGFCIKFGGAEQSADFLRHLGFSDDHIDLVQDTDFVHPSVAVGDVSHDIERVHGWSLDYIDFECFSTAFFTLDTADSS